MYEVIKTGAQPYLFLLFLLGGTITYNLWRRSRRVQIFSCTCWITLLALSLPLVGDSLMATVEHPHTPVSAYPNQVHALVTLGGGLLPPSWFRERVELTESSVRRCIYTAHLYRHYGGECEIVLCGGVTQANCKTSEAEEMRELLLQLGVDAGDIIMEDSSLNTWQNAERASELINRNDFQQIGLITDARHMRRAKPLFMNRGFQVTPFPCGYRSGAKSDKYFELFVPSLSSLSTSNDAIREWMGILWYWLRSRI